MDGDENNNPQHHIGYHWQNSIVGYIFNKPCILATNATNRLQIDVKTRDSVSRHDIFLQYTQSVLFDLFFSVS